MSLVQGLLLSHHTDWMSVSILKLQLWLLRGGTGGQASVLCLGLSLRRRGEVGFAQGGFSRMGWTP